VTFKPEFMCAVEFDTDVPCVVMEWRGYATSSIFRETNERVLRAIVERCATHLLGDIRDLVLIGADDQVWLNDIWLPRAMEAGLRQVALVQPTYYFNRVAVENVVRKLDPARLAVGYFADRADAKAWLTT
jgi:hypothetical protein